MSRFNVAKAQDLVLESIKLSKQKQQENRLEEINEWANDYADIFDSIWHAIEHSASCGMTNLSVSNKSLVRSFPYEASQMVKEYIESFGFGCSVMSSRGGMNPYIDSIKIYWPMEDQS
jgi:hypothetical protein